MGVITDLVRSIAPLRSIVFPGSTGWSSFFARPGMVGERDYSRFIGDGSRSNLIEAVVRWLGRYYVQAPIVLRQFDSLTDDVGQLVRRHEMLSLLRWPTREEGLPRGYYSGKQMGRALIASFVVDGNAYALKVRSITGDVVQLWYVPHWWIEPMWQADGSDFITRYDMRPDGASEATHLRVEDVVHIRDGVDPHNTRKGCSPIKTLLRELFVDEKTARFTAALINNFGVPGVVISPDGPGTITEAQADAAKAAFVTKFGGDRTGEPLVMRGATKVQPFGWSPQELDISALRDVPEERVAAIYGLPAAVVGFGTGLHQVKVGATMDSLMDQAMLNAFMPLTTTFDEEFAAQLLPEFVKDPDALELLEVEHDLSKLPVMAKWWLDQAELWTGLTKGSLAKRAEGRRRFGLPVGPEDDVYLIQAGVTTSRDGSAPAAGTPPAALPAAARLALGDGSRIGDGYRARHAEPEDPDPEDDENAADPPRRRLTINEEAALSDREWMVADAIARGEPNKAIAIDLGVSERTVERIVSGAVARLGLSSRADLAARRSVAPAVPATDPSAALLARIAVLEARPLSPTLALADGALRVEAPVPTQMKVTKRVTSRSPETGLILTVEEIHTPVPVEKGAR